MARLHLWVVPDRRAHRARAGTRGGIRPGAALRDSVFWLLSTPFVLEAAAAAGVMIILVSYLRAEGHAPQTAATLPILIGGLAVPIRLGLGRLARHWGMTLDSAGGFAVQALGAAVLWWAAGSVSLASTSLGGGHFLVVATVISLVSAVILLRVRAAPVPTRKQT